MASCLDIEKLPPKPMNYKLCCLCQTNTKEKLKTPHTLGYTSLETDLSDLSKYNALPSYLVEKGLELKRLNEGNGIAKSLRANKALYHKSCRNL